MQDRALTEIGKLELSKNTNLRPYQQYVEEITPGKVCTIALIMFAKADGKIQYKGIDVMNANQDNYQKFGYRKGSARGGDITFTTKFGNLSKKLKTTATLQWSSLLSVAKGVPNEESKLFEEWRDVFNENKAQIQQDLDAFYAGLDKTQQQASAFTLVMEINGEKKFPTDFVSIQKQILLSGTEGKKKKYNVVSEGKDNLCSICCNKKSVLYGFASPFKYATVDKPGTVSGYFNQANNWINYPICEDCALEFELGKNYVSKYLSRSFFGKRYYLVPKTILRNDETRLRKALKLMEAITYEISERDDIERREDYLMERLGGLDNLVSLNLLFYEENPTTKAIKIKLMLEEIPPSRFRTLFIEIPKIVNQHSLYINADYNFKTKEKRDLKFSFGLIRQFFDDGFHDIIHKVFMGHPLNRSDLFGRFMHTIRTNYNRRMTSEGFAENTSVTILKAHLVLRYLQELNITSTPTSTLMTLKTDEEEKQDSQKKTFDFEKLKAFLDANKDFFYSNQVAGVFALGVLVSLVFSLQYANLESTPFEKKLKGLHLSVTDLQRIYIDSISKINQYTSSSAYKELRELIAENFAANITKFTGLSNQEVSFYFVAGLELGRKFKSENSKVRK